MILSEEVNWLFMIIDIKFVLTKKHAHVVCMHGWSSVKLQSGLMTEASLFLMSTDLTEVSSLQVFIGTS